MGLYCVETVYPRCDEAAVGAFIDASSADKNEVLITKFTCPGQYLNDVWLHIPPFKTCFLCLASLTLCL